jgi:hypothetical protein
MPAPALPGYPGRAKGKTNMTILPDKPAAENNPPVPPEPRKCPDCRGTGRIDPIIDFPCITCDGTGILTVYVVVMK